VKKKLASETNIFHISGVESKKLIRRSFNHLSFPNGFEAKILGFF
jgi:hypothetical protein